MLLGEQLTEWLHNLQFSFAVQLWRTQAFVDFWKISFSLSRQRRVSTRCNSCDSANTFKVNQSGFKVSAELGRTRRQRVCCSEIGFIRTNTPNGLRLQSSNTIAASRTSKTFLAFGAVQDRRRRTSTSKSPTSAADSEPRSFSALKCSRSGGRNSSIGPKK